MAPSYNFSAEKEHVSKKVFWLTLASWNIKTTEQKEDEGKSACRNSIFKKQTRFFAFLNLPSVKVTMARTQ